MRPMCSDCHSSESLTTVRMVTARQRTVGVVAVILTLMWFYSHSLYRRSLAGFPFSALDTPDTNALSALLAPYQDHVPSPASEGALKSWGRRAKLRDNLRLDKQYIFSPWAAGWNNQVMQAMNMIMLAIMTDRIPILTPFVSQGSHVGVGGEKLAFGDVFDLSRLSASLGGLPIVEYRELKADDRNDPTSHESEDLREGLRVLVQRDHPNYTEGIYEEAPSANDQLGCWSYWATMGKVSHDGGGFYLDLQHTPLPTDVYTQPNDPSKAQRPDMNKIADLIRSQSNEYEQPKSARNALEQYKMQAPEVDPEGHIACVDFTFFFATHPEVEDVVSEYRAGTGAWARAGLYMRFRREWEELAAEYARRAFGLWEGDVPPYIAVHIRRGDFKHVESLDIRHYAHAVSAVQQTLKQRLGLVVPRVLIMTDETDLAWLAEVNAYPGFFHMDHLKERTTERYGVWHATIIDSILLSSAAGMVGLKDSTMAILAYRRVIDWKGGVGKFIHPGYKIADDYKYTPIA